MYQVKNVILIIFNFFFRFSYIVVPPWSSAQHPYVKAALMSTIIDLPCGCPSDEFASHLVDYTTENQLETSYEDDNFDNSTGDFSAHKSSTRIYSNAPVIDIDTDYVENIEDLLDNSNFLNESSRRKNSEFDVAMRIIIPSVHMHFDNKTQNYWKYDQFVLQTGNQSYHDHLQNGEKLFEFIKDQLNDTITDEKIFVGNRSIKDIQKIVKSDKIFSDQRGNFYKIHKELVGRDNVYELVPIEYDVVKLNHLMMFGIKKHYEQLNRWLMFKI